MKTLALALIALPLLTPQVAPVVLRRVFKADATDAYTIEDKVKETVKSPMGEMPVTISSVRTYTLKTMKVDDAAGTAHFQATTTFDKLDADGPAASLMNQKPKPMTQTGKLDVRGRMAFDAAAVDNSLAGLLNGLQGAASAGTFIEFPEKAVRVGDTWDIVVPKNPMVFDADQKLTAMLVGERDLDGAPVWVVSVKGTLRSSVDSSKLPNAKGIDTPLGPTSVRLKGQIDLTGEGLVEKSSGRTLSMKSSGASKMTLELVESGITFDTEGTINSTAKLVKP